MTRSRRKVLFGLMLVLAELFVDPSLLSAEDTKALFSRAVEAAKKRDYNRAISIYGRIIQLNPQSAAAYNNRGIVYTDTANYDKAIADLNEAIRLNSKDPRYYLNRGNAY